MHDSQEIVELIDKDNKVVYADSAYVGEKLQEELEKKNPNIELKINEKRYRNHPLTDEQKESNKEKSKVRVRVEHVFGHMKKSIGGILKEIKFF